MRHSRHSSRREFNFDPADLLDSIHDVIEAALDAGLDSAHAFAGRDCKSWSADEIRNEARAFAGRFAAHPSWRNAWARTSRTWSDTD